MNEVSVFRLYVLRAMYGFIVVGLARFCWPDVLASGSHWAPAEGMATCMIAAFSLMCLLGVRYPLQMLPVLLWEVTWKTMWLALVPLPQWMAGHVDAAIQPSVFACSMVVLVYLAIPWGYVWRHYVRASGTPWGWGVRRSAIAV